MSKSITGTKIAERLITSPDGSTMAQIIEATGGPQYNVLAKLEAKGYKIRKVKEGNTTRYFADAPASESFESTVTSNGQVTIPKEVRERLHLRSGHKLRFVVENGNRAIITPASKRLSDLAGVLPKPEKVVTLEQMDDAIARSAIDKYRRAATSGKQ